MRVNRSHAALAPKRPHSITPPAKSFLTTSCSASIEPAFSRCYSSSFLASQVNCLLAAAKYFAHYLCK